MNADYKEWRLPSRHRRETDQWQPPQDKFQANTTQQADYKEHSLSPREMFRPEGQLSAPHGRFQDSTGYRETYREHELPPRRQAQREVWSKPAAKFQGSTTQQSDFTGPYQPKRESFRPDRNPYLSDQPFQGSTTSQDAYQEKPLGEKYVHARQAYVKPEGKMDMTTTNETQFKEFPISRQVFEKPGSSHILRGQGDMAKESGYNVDFIEHQAARREMMKPKNNYEPPASKFEGRTTANVDYVEKQLSPRENYRPKWEPVANGGRFQDDTENRSSFVEQPFQPRQQRAREVYVASKVPFQSSTTMNDSYQDKFQPKRESFRPDRNPVTSDTPFQASTTSQDSYQEKPLGEKYVHARQAYVKPEGKMDMTTTNETQFKEFPISRQIFEKPESSHIMRGQGDMAKESGYNVDFIGHQAARREIMKPKNTYEPPSTRFEGQTTAQKDYVEKQLSPRETYRPKWEPAGNGGTFADDTENRSSFVAQPLQPRQQRAKEVYVAPSAPFHSTTTAAESYQEKFQPKRSSFKPDASPLKTDSKFDGQTTSKSDFKEHAVGPRYRHQHETYVRPEGSMEMVTSHQSNFRDLGLVERQAIQRPGSSHLLRGEGRIQDTTSYSGAFQEPPRQERELVKAKSEYRPSRDLFDDSTTQRLSYTGHYAPKQGSFKPPPRPLQQLNAFEDNPSFGADYSSGWLEAGPQVQPLSV